MKTLQIIDFDKQRPNSEPKKGSHARYYLIKMDRYLSVLAMYLLDENGNEDWYTSYTSKVTQKVTHWVNIEPLNLI